ncbi:MAG TPA: type VII secretion target [Actinocrinis sp.]|nr:type VII secretion target [Actinocrinis sp.]
MAIGEIGGGGGFQVDSQSLRGLAEIADNAGQSVGSLSAQIRSALDAGVPGGLDIGTAIGQARESWATRMTQLANESTGIGTNLNANATSYDQTEQGVLQSIYQPGSRPEFAL